jgi:ureidoglycolate lyase
VSEIILRAEPLTAAAFAPYGEVIEIDARASRWINDHTARRFDDLAELDVLADGGRPTLSIFEAAPRTLPLRARSLERHPLSSQAFFPLAGLAFLIVVAEAGPRPLAGRMHAYRSSGAQGVNYRRNTWHHPLIALARTSQFLVVDRGGPGENCEELAVDGTVLVTAAEHP